MRISIIRLWIDFINSCNFSQVLNAFQAILLLNCNYNSSKFHVLNKKSSCFEYFLLMFCFFLINLEFRCLTFSFRDNLILMMICVINILKGKKLKCFFILLIPLFKIQLFKYYFGWFFKWCPILMLFYHIHFWFI